MNQKDVYLTEKNNKVVIISGNTMNDNLGSCIVCPISDVVNNYASCVRTKNSEISKEVYHFIRDTSRISTIPKESLKEKVGEISAKELREVFMGLNYVLNY